MEIRKEAREAGNRGRARGARRGVEAEVARGSAQVGQRSTT